MKTKLMSPRPKTTAEEEDGEPEGDAEEDGETEEDAEASDRFLFEGAT